WWCQGWDDCGLMGLAFHPQFGQAGSLNEKTFFLCYQARNQAPAIGSAADVYRPIDQSYNYEIIGCSNRLARFTFSTTSVATTAGSEVILINQPDRHLWHNGADVFFGSDGFLYTLDGDEGKSDDAFNNTQRINRNFLSGVVRIDVDGPRAGISHAISRAPSKRNPDDVNEPAPFSGNYGIPNDNPFVGVPGVLEEFYALGLRSPHRMTYDAVSGRILVGDIGQGTREELDLIVPGGNYQWGYKEGHKNSRSDRIPSPYQAATATTAGSSTLALSYTSPAANSDLPAGILNAGDRVRFANHGTIYQVLSVSGYPHASISLSPPLTQSVPAATVLMRTTGFTIASVGASTAASDLPNDLGTSTFTLTGTGTLVLGTSVSFPGSSGSFQIIAASGAPNTTSITIRPALSSAPAVGATVDRLTVIGSEQPPVMDFSRSGATAFSAIIGGYIYRGTEHPALLGKYILADNQRGIVYAIDGIGTMSPTIQTLFTMPNYAQFDANGYRGIGGFGLNHDNEPLICRMQVNGAQTNTSSGQIWKISRDSGTVVGTPIPSELKDTGAFTLDGDGTLTSMTPATALIPYAVNSPLWSDAAYKRRWVSIPNGQQVTFTPTGS
ncbi:MAG TPA: PQQ-dependent sugar dehydrogenase, partial [Planctomycetota bacterium]|nr:PQQ-dependent sugar dehydrogenase [Planctomycetota bacterium]